MPSTIAAASVAAALYGIGWTTKSGQTKANLLNSLKEITKIEQVNRKQNVFDTLLRNLVRMVDE